MALLNLDFYHHVNDALYSDGEIEKELLEIVQNPDYDWFQDGRWPVVYHLSHLRHNILNWFPFKKNCTILEIGAGCGALTGLFCERASKVVAVELTRQRAEVNYQRHRHYENLEIVVCDIRDLPKSWEFDYVIVNGVLEYAAYMFQGDNPYEQFLKLSKNHLVPNGKLLLSIENRLGLKYFSGAREDHTGQFFSGINGYRSNERVRTFTKRELEELVQRSGLHTIKYYFPYPDYKFPMEIFTEKTVNLIAPSSLDYPFDMSRTKLFDDVEVYQVFMQQGIMQHFSNSFLVEIGLGENAEEADVSYAKISANRKSSYQIATIINANMSRVYKKGLTPEARNHVFSMTRYSEHTYAERGQIQNLICLPEEEGISYPFITKPTLKDVLVSFYENNDLTSFITTIESFRDALFDNHPKTYATEERITTILGKKECEQSLRWVAHANLDLIAGNIFLDNDKYYVIDYEWQFPFPLPIEFVLWRMITQLINDYGMQKFITKPTVYHLLEIDEVTEQCFISWENYFAKEYVGIKPIYQLYKDVIPINLEDAVASYFKGNRFISSLFFDIGIGYSEKHIESNFAVRSSDYYSVTFNHTDLKHANLLRWDPLEGNACRIRIKSLKTDGVVKEFRPVNASEVTESNEYIFHTYDPQFEIIGDFTNATYVQIDFYCEYLEWTIGYAKQEQQLIIARNLLEQQSATIDGLKKNAQDLKQIIAEREGQLQETLVAKDTVEKALKEQIAELNERLRSVTNELSETQFVLLRTQKQLHELFEYSKNHKLKAATKILLFGDLTRGIFNE